MSKSPRGQLQALGDELVKHGKDLRRACTAENPTAEQADALERCYRAFVGQVAAETFRAQHAALERARAYFTTKHPELLADFAAWMQETP